MSVRGRPAIPLSLTEGEKEELWSLIREGCCGLLLAEQGCRIRSCLIGEPPPHPIARAGKPEPQTQAGVLLPSHQPSRSNDTR